MLEVRCQARQMFVACLAAFPPRLKPLLWDDLTAELKPRPFKAKAKTLSDRAVVQATLFGSGGFGNNGMYCTFLLCTCKNPAPELRGKPGDLLLRLDQPFGENL